MRLEIKEESDEYPHFRIVRLGSWLHVYSYETGEGDWIWRPVERPFSHTSATTIASDVRFSKLMDSALTAELKTQRKATLLERIAARRE
jgi:hypothetical protein